MGVADCSSLGHDAITIGNRHGGEQEHYMDAGLRQQGLGIVSRSIDKRLKQVDRRDTDDRGCQFYFQYGCVYV